MKNLEDQKRQIMAYLKLRIGMNEECLRLACGADEDICLFQDAIAALIEEEQIVFQRSKSMVSNHVESWYYLFSHSPSQKKERPARPEPPVRTYTASAEEIAQMTRKNDPPTKLAQLRPKELEGYQSTNGVPPSKRLSRERETTYQNRKEIESFRKYNLTLAGLTEYVKLAEFCRRADITTRWMHDHPEQREAFYQKVREFKNCQKVAS